MFEMLALLMGVLLLKWLAFPGWPWAFYGWSLCWAVITGTLALLAWSERRTQREAHDAHHPTTGRGGKEKA
jgi:hypothetical protein